MGKLAEEAQSLPALTAASPASLNEALLKEAHNALVTAAVGAAADVQAASGRLEQAERELNRVRLHLTEAHRGQDTAYAALQATDQAASEVVKQRQDAERAVARLDATERQREAAREELARLREQRKVLKGDYLLERERVSNVREEVARQLQADAGGKVRVRVLRNAGAFPSRAPWRSS